MRKQVSLQVFHVCIFFYLIETDENRLVNTKDVWNEVTFKVLSASLQCL